VCVSTAIVVSVVCVSTAIVVLVVCVNFDCGPSCVCVSTEIVVSVVCLYECVNFDADVSFV